MPPWEPCAQAQVDVWLAERLGEMGSAYHLAFGFAITGPLDIAALEVACRALLRRHPILLTCYPERGGEPVRVPVPEPAWRLEHLAASEVPGESAATDTAIAGKMIRGWTTAPFDLARGPLVRTALARTGDDEHLLLFVCHHLVFDGMSRDILAGDLATLYTTAVRGAERGPDIGLRPLPPYRDYVAWQREQQTELPAGWDTLAALAGEPTRLSGGFRLVGKPRTGDATHDATGDGMVGGETAGGMVGGEMAGGMGSGGMTEVVLPPDLREPVAALAAQGGASPFAALLATVSVLLDKYHHAATGSAPVITIPCNTRPPEHAGCAGLFVNELPLRSPPDPDGSFRDHLASTAWRLQQTLALRSVPLAELARRTGDFARRGPASPGIVFGYRRIRSAEPSWHGLDVRFLRWLPVHATRAEVEFQLVDDGCPADGSPVDGSPVDGSGITGRILCYPGRLGGGAARQLAGHWLEAIKWLVATPDRPLAQLGLLRPPEQRRIVVDWNRTRVTRPAGDTLPGRFQAQVEATPGAVALVSGDHPGLTYAELNRRANQVAHRLRALRAGPESLVAVCVERSPELVVALLGVLKAGAGYLPLDPEHPPARRDFMLRDSGARVLVTQRQLHDLVPGYAPPGYAGTVLTLDDPEVLASQPETNPDPTAKPGHPAYGIYTSGSTGTPKAALIGHESICNRLDWMQERYRLDAADRVLQKTSAGFDVSVWEFFWPLLTGARLVLARPGGHRDVSYLVELINRAGVTTLHFVPPMLDAFLDHPGSGTCHSVRRVICSGEELPGRLVRRFFDRFTGAELHNLYGPTEATVDVSSWACDPAGRAEDRVPIGRPIANTQLYILDRDLHPVPVGVVGELYIGGTGLARGYLGRPALTAERFVPDPFSAGGGRLYRSGDLARYRADGAIEFLGRVDHQLKIRGNRVEPAEIEQALTAHPGVRQAVVLARGGSGETDLAGSPVGGLVGGLVGSLGGGLAGSPVGSLVGYVVATDPERAPSELDLLARLRQRLPEHMVPAAIVVLDALPLTANGKLDRRALPEPLPASPPVDGPVHRPPATPTERLVARVWSDLFGVAQIGADDDFFGLGGHSLLATRTVARLREAAGVELPMRVVFECSTVRSLAAAVEEASQR